jgi:2-polyprenyl-3-methyl-5-hydroxy-6-metoxy-1,4-benzoquinol methylase
LFPEAPSRILDVGAGTGVDARRFATRGHRVPAVEPVAAFRRAGIDRRPVSGVDWIDDSLPALSQVASRESFDVVLLSAVWNHLAPSERAEAIPRLAALLATGGLLVISVRHGPPPPNRHMFEVPVDETVASANAQGLAPVARVETPSTQELNRQAGVTWSWLAFRR